MDQFDIDKYFKKRIIGFSDEIDTDVLWNDLDLDEKKKDRAIFLWLFGCFSCLGLLAIVYFGIFTSDHKTADTFLDKSNNSHVSSIEKSEQVNSEDPSSESSIILNENAEIESNESSNKSNFSKRKTTKNQLTSSDYKQSNTSKSYIEKMLPNLSFDNSNSIIIEHKEQPENSNNSTRSLINKSDIISSPHFLEFKNLELLNFNVLESVSEREDFTNIVDRLLIEPLVPQYSNSFDLGFYTNYSLAQRSISTDYQSLNEFLESKDDSETVLDAIALGSFMRYNFISGFYIKLGIEALSITERFDHKENRIDSIVIDGGISSYHVSAQGDTTAVFGQSRTTGVVTSHWINHNHHRLLSLPLSIGYEWQSDRWSYFIEGGFHLNILYQFSGKQLNIYGDVSSESLDKKLKHSYVLSAGINYKLTPITSIYFQPRFQSTFSIRKDLDIESGSLISQNYKMYGVQVGMIYDLN